MRHARAALQRYLKPVGIVAGVAFILFIAFVLAADRSPGWAASLDKKPVASPLYNDNDIPGVVVARSWTGLWIGANVGYAAQTSKIAGGDGGYVSTPYSLYSQADGLTYGAAVGADIQVRRLVFGLFADWDKTNADAAFRVPMSSATIIGDIALKSMWAVGGRAGYLVTDHVLLYALAGLTTVNWNVPTNAIGMKEVSDPRGLTLGGGIEVIASTGLSIKLEYRFVDLGSDSLKFNVPGPLDATLNADHNLHQVRLGASYKFNFDRGGIAPAK